LLSKCFNIGASLHRRSCLERIAACYPRQQRVWQAFRAGASRAPAISTYRFSGSQTSMSSVRCRGSANKVREGSEGPGWLNVLGDLADPSVTVYESQPSTVQSARMNRTSCRRKLVRRQSAPARSSQQCTQGELSVNSRWTRNSKGPVRVPSPRRSEHEKMFN
jgi:hypothetical protein